MARTLLVSCLLVLVALSAGVDGLFWNFLNNINSATTSTNSASRTCTITANAQNCNANGPRVCARVGQTNRCVYFQNQCSFQYANCVNTVQRTRVNLSLCSNLSINTSGACSSTTSTSTGNNVITISGK